MAKQATLVPPEPPGMVVLVAILFAAGMADIGGAIGPRHPAYVCLMCCLPPLNR